MNPADNQKLIDSFLEKYKHLNFDFVHVTADGIENRPENFASKNYIPLGSNLEKYTVGKLNKTGDIAFVELKKTDTDQSVARFHELYIETDFGTGSRGLTVPFGVCEYTYPNGNIAGYEVWEGTPDEMRGVFPKDSLYFDPEGNMVTRPVFDLCFRNEHDLGKPFSENYAPVPEFTPRMKEYNNLVRDLADEFIYGGDRFGPQDIRELFLSDKPEIYLDALSADVMAKCALSKEIAPSEANLDAMCRLFIHGEVYMSSPGAESKVFNEDVLDRLGIDMSRIQTVTLDDAPKFFSESFGNPPGSVQDALYQTVYGFSDICHSKTDLPSNLMVIVDKDTQGRMMARRTEKGALAFKGFDETPMIVRSKAPYDRSVEFFYPDGTLCMSAKEMVGEPLAFDVKGNICNFAKARDTFNAAWGVQKNYIDIKYNNTEDSGLKHLMNAYESGFDSRVLLMEVDGVPQGFKQIVPDLKGEHTIRIHLDPSVKSTLPESLLKGIDGVVDVRSTSDDVNIRQFEVDWCRNNPEKAKAATTSESIKERQNLFKKQLQTQKQVPHLQPKPPKIKGFKLF